MAPVVPVDQVGVTDDADEGQATFRIDTAQATYQYQKTAAGFSSLLDSDGNDWISFNPTAGSGLQESSGASPILSTPRATSTPATPMQQAS